MDAEQTSRRGSETRQKQRRVTFRLTGDEHDALEAEAERAGLTVGSYIRSRLMDAPKLRAVPRPTVERELLAKTLAQLGRLNGNLHQIAKHLNFGGTDSADLPESLTQVQHMGAALMEALGRKPRV
jgi:hypothetical protein